MSWDHFPDLASRQVGGGVVWANDEFFAERENLIKPVEPVFQTYTFGHKGQVYDGWETRRRRAEGVDQAIIRLGMPGVVHGAVVDTAFFTGNYPPFASIEACGAEGYPDPAELTGWETLVPKSPLAGDTRNLFDVSDSRRYTHVRLTIYPDGGVARLRVHGSPVADPRFLDHRRLDLAALANGARIIDCSNKFYSSPNNLIAPGPAAVMGEGWETARRRDSGNDWVSVRLAAEGTVDLIELDTSHFKGNSPGWAGVSVADDSGSWTELLSRQRLQPDTRHLFRVSSDRPATQARLDVYPDGGVARLRLHGSLTPPGRRELVHRWADHLPPGQADAINMEIVNEWLP
jgi:allantoicase